MLMNTISKKPEFLRRIYVCIVGISLYQEARKRRYSGIRWSGKNKPWAVDKDNTTVPIEIEFPAVAKKKYSKENPNVMQFSFFWSRTKSKSIKLS